MNRENSDRSTDAEAPESETGHLSWRMLYSIVLGELVVLIIAFYLFMKFYT